MSSPSVNLKFHDKFSASLTEAVNRSLMNMKHVVCMLSMVVLKTESLLHSGALKIIKCSLSYITWDSRKER